MQVYGINSKDLREFTTTYKDLEKGVSRMPLSLAQLEDESVDQEIMDDFSGLMEHRSQAYSTKRSSLANARMPCDQESHKCAAAYQKSTSDSTVFFEDFKIINIVGKGTFGKVWFGANGNRCIWCRT